MLMLMMSSFIAAAVPILVLIITWNLSVQMSADHEKSSPFECGFDPYSSARVPFSLRFFLLAIIFIVFDIEVVLLIPIPLLFKFTNISSITISSLTFLLILLIGLIHEWKEGSLQWSK